MNKDEYIIIEDAPQNHDLSPTMLKDVEFAKIHMKNCLHNENLFAEIDELVHIF